MHRYQRSKKSINRQGSKLDRKVARFEGETPKSAIGRKFKNMGKKFERMGKDILSRLRNNTHSHKPTRDQKSTIKDNTAKLNSQKGFKNPALLKNTKEALLTLVSEINSASPDIKEIVEMIDDFIASQGAFKYHGNTSILSKLNTALSKHKSLCDFQVCDSVLKLQQNQEKI